jgi:DNA processing protein
VSGEEERLHAVTIPRSHPSYPPLLTELHDPPRRLFVRGGPPAVLGEGAVAVVGARSCSAYGAEVARSVARDLAAAGLVVVSGLARGIDAEAHRGALEAGGRTVAVLGCGIDRDYPRAHADLARRIAASGAVVSEYPPGTEPAPWRFPARNRIIAALARATVVVEARSRSGALGTVDFALELGREVFAVPGEITAALSAGTNDLLRQGAAPLLTADDVLSALGIERDPQWRADVSAAASDILALLGDGACVADELVRRSGRPSAEVAAALVELELARAAAHADGVYRATVNAGGTLSRGGRRPRERTGGSP